MIQQFKCGIVSIILSISLSLIFSPSTYADTELKLLTLNIWQFPYGIVSKNNSDRADRLVETLIEHHEEFDVIGIQELWSNRTRQKIYQGISKYYPYKYEDTDWGYLVFGFHSGLAFYSKFPITRKVTHTYSVYRGHENLAKKGIMGVELDVSGIPVIVFTTHMQAGDGGPIFRWWDKNKLTTSEIAQLQLLEAGEQIKEFAQNQSSASASTPAKINAEYIFFMGDFNLDAKKEEFRDGLAALEAGLNGPNYSVNNESTNSFDNDSKNNIKLLSYYVRDTFDSEKSPLQYTFWENSDSGRRIDFILTLGRTPSGYSYIPKYFDHTISDHNAVAGHFLLKSEDAPVNTSRNSNDN